MADVQVMLVNVPLVDGAQMVLSCQLHMFSHGSIKMHTDMRRAFPGVT